MTERFRADLRAHELPRQTLVDLWHRTVEAHEKLSGTWSSAVAARYGREVANEIALEGWPLLRQGATPKQLFFDDLRFIVAATELKPDMLTVADRDQAETPPELTSDRAWFQWLVTSSKLLSGKKRSQGRAWVGSPGRVRGFALGKGIEVGFAAMLKAWHATQRAHAARADVDAFEAKVERDYDPKLLGLLWNYAALAYMLGTDRWYTGVRRRYGDDAAQELEKDVWVDRGAAEHDLVIGQQAMGITGRDVKSLLRSFQFAPGEVGILDVELELIDPNHGVITHHRCPALDRFEHFDDVRLKHCCDICLAAMPLSGEVINEEIECKPLKLPPRADANDIACKWEFRLRNRQ